MQNKQYVRNIWHVRNEGSTEDSRGVYIKEAERCLIKVPEQKHLEPSLYTETANPEKLYSTRNKSLSKKHIITIKK